MAETIERCGSNIKYPPTGETMWCDENPGHDGRHWHKNVSWPKGTVHATTTNKIARGEESTEEFLTEMEMRSAHASFVAAAGGRDPWFSWSFQRRNYSPILFCLRMFYEFQEARAEDLYE